MAEHILAFKSMTSDSNNKASFSVTLS